jgi:hypothetical protein
MATRMLTMSHTELDRFGVITRVRERRLRCLASEADPAAVGFRISSGEPSLL